MMFRRLAVLPLAGLLLAPAVTEAAPVLYGITFTEQLISIDMTTGTGTLIGGLSRRSTRTIWAQRVETSIRSIRTPTC